MATHIIYKIGDLRHDGYKICEVWTPAHTHGTDGNQSVRNAARECLRVRPMIPGFTQEQPYPQQACDIHCQI